MRGLGIHPAELVVLQGNSLCNLDCKYCDLSAESRRANRVMGTDVVHRLFEDLFTHDLAASRLTVVWHSGEPLTVAPSYYDRAIGLITALRDTHAPQVALTFKIQTNGVLIDEEWCALFARHHEVFEVGVSCDGPAEMHDAYRLNWGGRPTHAATVRGMDLLETHGIRYKVIAVVTHATLSQPRAFFDFFYARRHQLSGFRFNILAASTSGDAALAYSREDRPAYYEFYRSLLALGRERGDFPIENFTLGFASITQPQREESDAYPGAAAAPIKALTVDAQGEVTTFYAGLTADTLKGLYGDGRGMALGNILQCSLESMLASEKFRRIAADFATSAAACRKECPYFRVCPGGYEVTKYQAHGTFASAETNECVIHVKALMDALLDDIDEHLVKAPNPTLVTA
jgi:uncharacterized protein